MRRPAMMLGPAMFLALSLVCLTAPDAGTGNFYVVMSAICAFWFVRCLRIAVVIDDRGVLIRGQL